jgi:hypothetical protein
MNSQMIVERLVWQVKHRNYLRECLLVQLSGTL